MGNASKERHKEGIIILVKVLDDTWLTIERNAFWISLLRTSILSFLGGGDLQVFSPVDLTRVVELDPHPIQI